VCGIPSILIILNVATFQTYLDTFLEFSDNQEDHRKGLSCHVIIIVEVLLYCIYTYNIRLSSNVI